MNKMLVCGLGYGDEGKGATVHYLCSQLIDPNDRDAAIVIRFSGGHQVGHTVIHDNIRHVFSNFGSGTLLGIPTYWSEQCTIEPIGLFNEMQILDSECKCYPQIYFNFNCPITTPYDMMHNQINSDSRKHGTTGVGFGQTLQREEDHFHLQLLDVLYPDIFKEKLRLIKEIYYIHCVSNKHLNNFNMSIEKLRQYLLNDTNFHAVSDIPKKYSSLFSTQIYEGSQGLLLDQRYGFFPHVTRADLTPDYNQFFPCEKNGDRSVWLVTRAYTTRHGNGFMQNFMEHINKYSFLINENENETNITNKFQGDFRKAILDISYIEYVILKDEFLNTFLKFNLVITCMDQLKIYQFIYNNELYECETKEIFIKEIGNKLKLKDIHVDIYISESEDSNELEYICDNYLS